jgi:hypothetical protein
MMKRFVASFATLLIAGIGLAGCAPAEPPATPPADRPVMPTPETTPTPPATTGDPTVSPTPETTTPGATTPRTTTPGTTTPLPGEAPTPDQTSDVEERQADDLPPVRDDADDDLDQ